MSADILEIVQGLKAQVTSFEDRMIKINDKLERLDNKIDKVLTNGGSLDIKVESVEDNRDLAQPPADLNLSQAKGDYEDEMQSNRDEWRSGNDQGSCGSGSPAS